MRIHALAAAVALVGATHAAPPSPLQTDQKDPTKAPKIYVVPFGMDGNGQIGTDIHSSVYEKVVKDVKAKKPDLLILKLESFDRKRRDWLGDDTRREEMGRFDREDARKTLNFFTKDLGDIPQVMWVKDSVGFGTVFALAWPYMYTDGEARLYGLARVNEFTQHPDPEVQRKFEAAFISIVNGFLKEGGHPDVLGLAMIRPEKKLSVSFKGRELEWRPDTSGTIVVDSDENRVANFDARLAEDLGLSRGTADSVEDLMFQLGYREWDDSLGKSGQDGVKLVGDYITGWRKAWTDSLEAYGQYDQASKATDAKSTGKAVKALEQIKSAMTRYPAVELRWKMRGMDRSAVEGLIKQLKERPKSDLGTAPHGTGGTP